MTAAGIWDLRKYCEDEFFYEEWDQGETTVDEDGCETTTYEDGAPTGGVQMELMADQGDEFANTETWTAPQVSYDPKPDATETYDDGSTLRCEDGFSSWTDANGNTEVYEAPIEEIRDDGTIIYTYSDGTVEIPGLTDHLGHMA